MGLLDSLGSSSKPAASATAETSTRVSTVEAPDRRTRAQCWDARDRFFGCLDRHDIVDSIKEKDRSDRACGQEDAAFGRECVTSWVTYFKQRRVMEYNKKQTLERLASQGAQPMPDAGSASPNSTVLPSAVAAAAKREGSKS